MTQRIWISFLTLFIFNTFTHATERGKTLYQQCAGCHGEDGRHKAFGKSGIIAGQNKEVLLESLKFYKERDFKTHSTSLVMSKQVKTMNLQDLIDVSTYVSSLKP